MYLIAGGQCGAEDGVENKASKEEAVVANSIISSLLQNTTVGV